MFICRAKTALVSLRSGVMSSAAVDLRWGKNFVLRPEVGCAVFSEEEFQKAWAALYS